MESNGEASEERKLGAWGAAHQPKGAGEKRRAEEVKGRGSGAGGAGPLGPAAPWPLEPSRHDTRLALGRLTGDSAFQRVLSMHRSS